MNQALVVWESVKKAFLGEPRQRGGKGLGVVKWFCQAGTEAAESEASDHRGRTSPTKQMAWIYCCSLGSNFKGLFIYEGVICKREKLSGNVVRY